MSIDDLIPYCNKYVVIVVKMNEKDYSFSTGWLRYIKDKYQCELLNKFQTTNGETFITTKPITPLVATDIVKVAEIMQVNNLGGKEND